MPRFSLDHTICHQQSAAKAKNKEVFEV
jgi:hypothetical protein